jgi:hypothetical protein
VKAALGPPEAFKAWARTKVAEKMSAAKVDLEFFAGGGCKVVQSLPGKEPEEATGTFVQQGERVTVTMTTVNGKPAKGKDAQPVTMMLRNGRLTFSPAPGAPRIVARRAA